MVAMEDTFAWGSVIMQAGGVKVDLYLCVKRYITVCFIGVNND